MKNSGKIWSMLLFFLLAHTFSLSAQAEKQSQSPAVPSDTTQLEAVWAYATYLHDGHHYLPALKYYQIYMRAVKSDPTLLAPVFHNIAELLSEMHRYTAAEAFYRKALQQYDALYDVDQESYRFYIARTQHNLGCMYFEQERYKEAEEQFIKALRNRERLMVIAPAKMRSPIAETEGMLGALYDKQNSDGEAEKYYAKALKHFSKITDPTFDDMSTHALIENNLGSLYRKLVRYDEAEMICKEAVSLYKRLYDVSPDYIRPFYALALENLGNLYFLMGKDPLAFTCYNESLVLRKTLDEMTPELYHQPLQNLKDRLAELAARGFSNNILYQLSFWHFIQYQHFSSVI